MLSAAEWIELAVFERELADLRVKKDFIDSDIVAKYFSDKIQTLKRKQEEK